MIIKFLSTIYTIFYAYIYSTIIQILTFFINIFTFTESKGFNAIVFIFTIVTEIFAGFGILFYCEVIELNFCNLNFYIRRKIIERGKEDLINNEDRNIKKYFSIGDGNDDDSEDFDYSAELSINYINKNKN